MDRYPSIAIVSCSNTKPKSLIKLITKEAKLAEDSSEAGLVEQPWIIDTKYYKANVVLQGIEDEFKRSEDFINNIEALIIHLDSNKQTGLDDLAKFDDLIEGDPEIKLLISNYCNDDTKVSKAQAIEWCLKRGFEFIELYPTITKSEPDEQEVIKEKFGVDRIVESLQTHTWSNLVMKGKSDLIKSEQLSYTSEENDMFLTSEGLDDFSELFSQLHMMKDSLQSMPTTQRKQCAEQMVTAFWEAIGGEEEEIVDM